MNKHDVDARVKHVLADVLALDVSEVDETTSKETVEAWTSLNNLSVVMALEEEFGVSFSDNETDGMVNFTSVVAAVSRKLAD